MQRPGDYARLPIWWGQANWVDKMVPAALARRGQLPAHYPVATDTAQRIASELASSADYRTGRGARPTVDELIKNTGSCERTIQYTLALLEALGIVVRVVQGRSRMTLAERLWAWHNGSRARRIAAEFALVVPAALARTVHRLARDHVDGCTPPVGDVRKRDISSERGVSSRPDRASRSLAGARHPPRRSEPATTPARARHARLVAELQDRISWLSGCSPARLTSLHRFAAHGWSGRDVDEAIGALLRARRWRVPQRVANPPAYLAMLLRGLEPTDRQAGVDDELPARSAREWRNELARWRNVRANGPECSHGYLGGNLPHPINGHKPCPSCRKETDHESQ